MNRTRLLVLQLAVITIVCGFLFFFHLGAFGLVGTDEPRYAQVAREMFNRHDWVVPTLNGQPWLEKPVFLYWKIINCYKVFGVRDWAARVPSAFHALALVWVVFFFMRRFRPGTEMDAAFISVASAAVIAFGRGASTDMPLASHFTLAMLAWWSWHATGRKLWLACFFALLAFATLAKGPVAPGLAALIVGAYALLRRDKKVFLRSLWWPGFILFFAIALPWYVAVQMRVPHFFHIFFIEHNLERFGTNLYQHTQPLWYYVPVFALSTLPWTLFTIMAIVNAFRSKVWQTHADDASQDDRHGLHLFLLLWILIPIVFFSISRSKLPGYILPAIPAAAILTADYLERGLRSLPRWAMMLHSLICGGLVSAALMAPLRMLKVHPTQSVVWVVVIGGVMMAMIVLFFIWRGLPHSLEFTTMIPVIVVVTFLLGPAAPVIDEVNSARTVNASLQQLGAPQEPIAVFDVKRDVEYGLNFYRDQAVSRYERNEIPAEAHVLITKEGNKDAAAALLGQRQISPLGSFPVQHLEFFLISK